MALSQANPSHRFGGIERLYGPGSLDVLGEARVMVVGIGGVGTWIAEALARSAVGHLDLVDLDDVCESNINRQLHALDGTIGKPKVEAMADRCRLINPNMRVVAHHCFFTQKTADELLSSEIHYVADAIDSVRHKCTLIARCREAGIPVIASGGAGGRVAPSAIRIDDLARSQKDPLLQRTRKQLRQHHGFPRDPKALFGVDCVFSLEMARYPEACDAEEAGSFRLDCSTGYGAASFVTGAFGLMAASHIVSQIIATKRGA